jgi:hypothetical protein
MPLMASSLFGVSDVCFQTQLGSLMGMMYPEDSALCFGIYQVSQVTFSNFILPLYSVARGNIKTGPRTTYCLSKSIASYISGHCSRRSVLIQLIRRSLLPFGDTGCVLHCGNCYVCYCCGETKGLIANTICFVCFFDGGAFNLNANSLAHVQTTR